MNDEWEEVSRNEANEKGIPSYITYKWGEYEVSVRFDKCVHVYRDVGDDERDYIHICDFPDFVEMLNKLVKKAEWIW